MVGWILGRRGVWGWKGVWERRERWKGKLKDEERSFKSGTAKYGWGRTELNFLKD
jgi:hypothetical protein